MRQRQGKYPFIIGFLAIPVTLYAVFVIGPYIQAFYIAMTNWKGVSANPQFIGFENFEKLFDDERFLKAVGHHVVLLLALPLITVIIALFLAFLLNVAGGTRGGGMTGVWGSKFYKIVFFFPQVLAVALLGVIFGAVYRPDSTGGLNGLLRLIGISPVGWLTEPSLALWSIIGVLVWQRKSVRYWVNSFSAVMM